MSSDVHNVDKRDDDTGPFQFMAKKYRPRLLSPPPPDPHLMH